MNSYSHRTKRGSFYFYGVCIGVVLLLTGCVREITGTVKTMIVDGTREVLTKEYTGMGSSLDVAAAPTFNHQKIKKIAVIMRPDENYRDVPYRRVEDLFMLDLLKKGYQVASRSDVEQVMEEITFQGSSLTEDSIAKIGRILNVSVVLIVSVTDLQTSGKYLSTALGTRLIGVEKAELLWGATCSGKGSEVGSTLEGLAKQIAEAFPSKMVAL